MAPLLLCCKSAACSHEVCTASMLSLPYAVAEMVSAGEQLLFGDHQFYNVLITSMSAVSRYMVSVSQWIHGQRQSIMAACIMGTWAQQVKQ